MLYSVIFDVLIGVIIAVACLLIFKVRNIEKEILRWGYGLVIAAIVYLGFSIVNQEWQWVFVEAGGVAIYGLIFMAARKYNLLLISIGWMLHVLWDVILHMAIIPGYAPFWYPEFCIGFDVVIAGYLFWRMKNQAL